MRNGGMPRERDGCTCYLSRGNLLSKQVSSHLYGRGWEEATAEKTERTSPHMAQRQESRQCP
jgi:hypothetical protein